MNDREREREREWEKRKQKRIGERERNTNGPEKKRYICTYSGKNSEMNEWINSNRPDLYFIKVKPKIRSDETKINCVVVVAR